MPRNLNKDSKKTIWPVLALALVSLPSLPASADIAVVNSAPFFIDNADRTGYTFAFIAGNADKLVLSIATESNVPVTGVTFHGAALTQIAASGSAAGGRNRGIWYLDNPHTAGAANIVISGNGVDNFSQIGLGVVSLSGTGAGHEAAATGASTSVSLTIPGDQSFVFACIATNSAAAPSANPPLTQLYGGQPESMASGAGYVTRAASGSHTYSFTVAGASPEVGVASFAEVFVPDTTAPVIVSLIPADGDIHVAVNANLEANFDEAVQKGNGNITIHKSDGTPVETIDVNSTAVTVDGAVLTINPGGNLDSGAGYYVLIDSTAIKDASGNDFAGISNPGTWNFTTRPGLDTVEGRMVAMLQANIDSPWPGISNPNNSSGVFPYALACLYLNQNVSQANDLIFDFYTNNPIPANTSSDGAGYFWQHIMWRLYHNPTSNGRLATRTRNLIEDNMWNWVLNRSTRVEALQTEWKIHDSENHDAMQKGSHMMCLLALKNSPRYGPNQVLSDGGTIADHLAAWTDFYLRYFKTRAMEGINVEIASAQYARYTVGVYYNIMDFSDSPKLRAIAKQFIDLYWADTVSDWVSSGVRGGAQTRCYREGNYLKMGSTYAFYGLLWGYKWREGTGGVSTYGLIQATSPYRVPDIITAIATDPARPNFLYSSRRFGRGGAWDAKKDYSVVFDNGNSNLRRDTWVTPDYSMGTLTVDMNRDYIALIDQNRVMGVTFASGVNHRIMVCGQGGTADTTKSFADISGVTRQDCMIVQRDKNAYQTGTATQIFVAQAAWNNRVENGGWFFTQLGNAYCAIRPAGGGYTNASTGSGHYLTLGDMWAPVIIQTGQAHNYSNFTDFQNSVIANALTYSAGIMNYTSEAGETFTFHANSKTTPKVNGATVNLNPAKTYESPYLSMVHGEEIATVSYAGYPNLILDFGDPPTLVSSNPADNATGVAVAADLIASFHKPVVAGSGFIVLRRSSNNSVVETFDVSNSPRLTFGGSTLRINPTADLNPFTTYHVTIDSTAVKDSSGNAFAGLAGNSAWNFTTNDGSPLPITAVNNGTFGGSAPGATVTESITVGVGADMLIVVTSAELGGTNPTPMAVTYGGVAMNQAVGNLTNSGIWYLDLATPGITGTNLAVDMSGYTSRNGFAAGWVSIDGNLGTGESIVLHSTGTSAAQSNTVDLTTTVETFNVVNFNGNNTNRAITVNSPNPTVIYTDTNIGSAESAAAYASAVAAGSHTYQWNLGLTPPHADYRRIDAAAFAVVQTVAGNDFSDWIAGYPEAGAQTGLGDDPDGDGIPSGVEAWFGTHPVESSGGLSNLTSAGTAMTFTHPRSANPPDDLTIVYQWSPNLTDWYLGDGADGPLHGPTVTISTITVDATTTVTATASEPMNDLFLRIGVVRISSP